jgi:thymidylate synthase ThyX
MKTIGAHVEEITFHVPEGYTIEQWLEKVGRVCYKSEDRITEESAPKFIKMLRDNGHYAIIEHAVASARIVGDRGLCYDDQTEVLTYDGWKLFKDISDEDLFFTLNMKTKKAEYQAKTETIVEDWDGEMICGKSSVVDFVVTPNHRMVWFHYDSKKDRNWKINKAEEIYKKRVKFQRGLFHPFYGKLPTSNVIKDIANLDFARFMGIFITYGSCKDGRVIIAQNRNYTKKILNRLLWNYKELKHGFVINNTQLYTFLREYKRIPNWIRHSTSEYIEAFLEGAANKHIDSRQMAGDFQELFMKIGFCASVKTMSDGKQIVSVTKRTNQHLFNKKHWSKKHYVGKVYCVTVPNGTLYVRRNGKALWSGNTHELVRHRIASYAQESTRYCNYTKGKFNNEITVIEQPGMNEEQTTEWEAAMLDAEKHYFRLVEMGLKPQIARSVLPIGLKSEIVITANLREWIWIFEMRCSKFAHPIIRDVALNILNAFNDRLPTIYEKQAEKFLTTRD